MKGRRATDGLWLGKRGGGGERSSKVSILGDIKKETKGEAHLARRNDFVLKCSIFDFSGQPIQRLSTAIHTLSTITRIPETHTLKPTTNVLRFWYPPGATVTQQTGKSWSKPVSEEGSRKHCITAQVITSQAPYPRHLFPKQQ